MDLAHVARHVVVVVVERRGGPVAAVVPHVEHDDVVARGKELPERQIAVDGEPVAVAREDADSGIRVAVTAHDDMRPVGHRQIDDFDGLRDLENAQRTILPAMLSLTAGASLYPNGAGGQTGQVVTDRKFSLSLRS